MRHLLNTLFVLTEDCYLTLDGENVAVKRPRPRVFHCIRWRASSVLPIPAPARP